MLVREKTALEKFGDFVKIAVDITREVVSAGCELHVDCAEELLEDGSEYANVWGANVYPSDKKIDFVSLINIRPAIGNRSMTIENEAIRNRVEAVIKKLFNF